MTRKSRHTAQIFTSVPLRIADNFNYEEVLKTYRLLAGEQPDTYLPYVALTLTNLGNLDATQNRMEEARAHYQDAIGIYKELSRRDPNRYAADLRRVESVLAALDQNSTDK